MKTLMRWNILAIVGLMTNTIQAAEPALEVQLQSVQQLLSNAEYIGSLIGQEEAAKQIQGFVEQTGKGESGFYGLDIDKPVGLYAFVEKDLQKSRIMLLLPVKDQDAVLNTMKQLGQLDPQLDEGGYYSVEVPDVPYPVFFRFSDGYLHATLQNRDAMMAKMMLRPAQFFAAKQTSIASVVARIDEVPMDVRKTLFGQFEFGYTESMNENYEAGSFEAEVADFFNDQLLNGMKQVLMEGQNLEITFDIKPESDEFDLKVTFDAVADSDLKRTISGWQNRSSVAGRLTVPKNPLFLEQGNFALGPVSQAEWAKLVDKIIDKAMTEAKNGGERVAYKMAFDAVAPTLKAGVFDFGIVVTETDKGLNSVFALKVVKGTDLAKTVQTFSAFADKEDAEFQFNIEEVNGITLHKVTIKEADFAKVTGTKYLWLGSSNDVVLASIEENGDAIRKAAKGDAGSAPINKAEASVARLVTISPEIDPKGFAQDSVKTVYGETGPKGRDSVTFSATGGETLTLNLKLKGSVIHFFYEVDQLKKNQ